MSEARIQTQVSKYLKLQYPDVIFTSESSGLKVTMGQAVAMKAQRSAHKLPDMIILEPRGKYHGLCLELKKTWAAAFTKDGEVRKARHIQEQYKTLQALSDKGYKAEFAGGLDHAREIIDAYMNISI